MAAVAWHELGTEAGKKLVAGADQCSLTIKEDLALFYADREFFATSRWRYEFCIFRMFWMWYLGNSPRLTKAGATEKLLDAYHQACYDAMAAAGLIPEGKNALRAWQEDIEERFMVYKGAYENVHSQPEFRIRVGPPGSLGWMLARFLAPTKRPDIRFVALLNDLAMIEFTGLTDLFKEPRNVLAAFLNFSTSVNQD